jgi:hypothetical protein
MLWRAAGLRLLIGRAASFSRAPAEPVPEAAPKEHRGGLGVVAESEVIPVMLASAD